MRRFYQGSDLSRVLSVAEMAALARYRLPDFAWEYLAGGAENELTLRSNETDFSKIRLTSHTLVANHRPELATTLVGSNSALPMMIGPSGFNGMLWPQADIALAKAASAKNIPFCLSTVSNASIEEVREAVQDIDVWFQLYSLKNPLTNHDLLARAKAVDVSTLVITTDALVVGNREWDRRNFAKPRQLTWRNKVNVLKHPNWVRRVMLPNGLPTMGNLNPYLPPNEKSALGAMKFIQEQLDTSLDWEKIAKIRDQWHGKLILKGVLHPDNARQAVALGFDGLVVSNHGGRQLDGALSSIEALPAIVDAVGGQIDILLDGGIRRGSDIIKAKALGVQGVMLGRATLFGVASGGQVGATRVLDILEEELIRSLNLMGVQRLDDLTPQHLYLS
ncbi:alpha-hydroxy-acid oxidizing enzyme [Marinomonas primoryensis]|uniref:Alpha-hydroxy-acid oxidizing enzyme n=1 Tax=Marinomonas primoryensis TaxID=178399 RepID=A0A2Z4PVJ0_9GAMM|nr:alpha-hydroxy acid oxidase [Marinomonas primoryensis]AWY01596.1 alpha-hydroxy-acid oxidizing enzyme [Marinomonas primoryensis]